MVAHQTDGDIRGNPSLRYGYYRKVATVAHRCKPTLVRFDSYGAP